MGADPGWQRDCAIGGVRVRLSARHPEVARALEGRFGVHAAPTATAPDVELRFREDARNRGAGAAAGAHRVVYETPSGTVRYHPDVDVLAADFGGATLHAELGRGVAWIGGGAAAGEQRHRATHTLATLALMELLKRRDRFPLHVACLGRKGRGVLLAGPSGAGKSTLALALARAGLDYLADDLSFLRHDGGRVRAFGLADAIGVTDHTRSLFPEIASVCGVGRPPGFPKQLIRPEKLFDIRIVPDCTPCALIFPEIVSGADSRIEPLDPGDAWLRLVPDILLTHPQATQSHLTVIATLTAQVSCHRLLAGADVDASARLVGALL